MITNRRCVNCSSTETYIICGSNGVRCYRTHIRVNLVRANAEHIKNKILPFGLIDTN
jgi:hypothetical protein